MNPIKILLVDDSKSARYALRLQLQRHETQVETAESAESALEQIGAGHPDAVFMDHTMPGMNGFEALDILKADAATKGIPVVMCTSNEDPEYREQALRKGALDVLAKSTAKNRLPQLLEHIRGVISGVPTARAAAPAAAAPDMASIEEAIRREAAGLLEARLEEVLEERLQAAMMPLLADFGDRLTSDTQAQIDRRLAERTESESQRLEARINTVLDQQTKLSSERLAAEVLPQAVSQQFDQERTNLAKLVQELLDSSLDNIAEQSDLVARISERVEASVLTSVEQIARGQATEVAEQVAKAQSGTVAQALADAGKSGSGTPYLLFAAAALIGVGAAAGVYFLLG
jgi:CheY-like chemotaxis protein